MIENLLRKNLQKRKGWSKQTRTNAYRLYDWQIPEYPFFIDVYGDDVLVYDRTEEKDIDKKEEMIKEIQSAVSLLLDTSIDKIIWKMRTRQKKKDQYERLSRSNQRKVVYESGRQYMVNLRDYLDTGLFLDHRPLRNKFSKENHGHFLNLFSYTCAVGVAAALGGARTTNVDLSNNYLKWGKENYKINGLDLDKHNFVSTDVLEWLEVSTGIFDTVFLDPPSFSNSKKMTSDSFDVLRDQDLLVDQCMKKLKPGGKLYFSTNHSKFRLSERLKKLGPKDITEETIPFDFHNKRIHRCFLFEK